MERLTYKDEAGYHLKIEHEDADTVTALGLYEDTGLSPEGIRTEVKMNHSLADLCNDLEANLRAYVAAERAGQLVRLPCKIGDKVWTLKQAGKGGKRVFETKVAQMYFSDDMRLIVRAKYYKPGEIGQYIFLTREEAEAALRRKEEERWT